MLESKSSGARICLFGGTFDPIHSAHLRIAEEAVRSLQLDRVLFVPAGTPPHKTGVLITPYEDRLQMVELACAPYPKFEASRLEEREGRSYTIETVLRFRRLLKLGDRLFFLIGADAFDDIESWKDWRKLMELIEFIVVTRPGGTYKIPERARVQALEGLELPVSSSSIRARLSVRAPTPELPAAVRAYIEERGLYRLLEESSVLQ
jgi:nicotinate-nucleotide adenylyltransferase